MNVLHLTTHLRIGGISSYLLTLSKALAAEGCRMSVLSAGGSFSAELEKAGTPCHQLPIRTKNEFHPKLFLAVPKVVSLIKSGGFGLVHAHTRVTQVLARTACGRAGVPFVSTAHGFYKPRLSRRLFPCWGERVIAVSALVAEELEKRHGVRREKIRIVHNAVDMRALGQSLAGSDRHAFRTSQGIPPKAFVLGCISRLVRDKGQAYLLEAVKLLSKDMPQAHAVIIGDGRERENLGRLASDSVLSGKVTFIPSTTDTAGWLSAMDVFVHPATYREGFGLSVAEAMAVGKPVIATDIPAIHSILTNGSNALIVPPKDAPALAAAVRYLAAEPAAAARLAENGKKLAQELCGLERMGKQVTEVYQEVLSSWKTS